MFIDTSATCDVCKMMHLCQRYRKLIDFQSLVDKSIIQSPNGDYWPTRCYIDESFKIKHACDFLVPEV